MNYSLVLLNSSEVRPLAVAVLKPRLVRGFYMATAPCHENQVFCVAKVVRCSECNNRKHKVFSVVSERKSGA